MMEIEDLILSPELISKIYMDSHLGLDLVLFKIPNETGSLPLDWMVGVPNLLCSHHMQNLESYLPLQLKSSNFGNKI